MTDPNLPPTSTPPPEEPRPQTTIHNNAPPPEKSGGGGSGWLIFIVGGLVVLVAILAWVFWSGGAMTPTSEDRDVDISIEAPTLPDMPEPPANPLPGGPGTGSGARHGGISFGKQTDVPVPAAGAFFYGPTGWRPRQSRAVRRQAEARGRRPRFASIRATRPAAVRPSWAAISSSTAQNSGSSATEVAWPASRTERFFRVDTTRSHQSGSGYAGSFATSGGSS